MRCLKKVGRDGLMMVVAIGILGLTGQTHAGDYYKTVPFLPTVKIGANTNGATPSTQVYGKEYSHTDWFSVYSGAVGAAPGDPNLVNFEDHNAFAVADPLQVVSWDGLPGPIGGNSGSVDGFDYGSAGTFNFPNGQIDALANHADLLFRQVTRDEATLLFSVTGDLDISTVLPPPGGGTAGIVAKAHVHYEDPSAGHGVWASIEAPPAGPGTGPGVNHHVVEDLDALEVWGPEPPSHTDADTPVIEGYIGGFPGANTADADRFSLDNDSISGISVWAYSIPTAIVTPYIPHSEIVTAIEKLFIGDETLRFSDETRRQLDVDATMVHDVGQVTSDTAPALWDPSDELLFSIDPIDAEIVDASGAIVGTITIDGGEIMHLTKLLPGAGFGTIDIKFLTHGGHLWDTTFDLSSTFGYYYEDVDALEAVGTLDGDREIDTPEPTSFALLALGALGLTRRRRR